MTSHAYERARAIERELAEIRPPYLPHADEYADELAELRRGASPLPPRRRILEEPFELPQSAN